MGVLIKTCNIVRLYGGEGKTSLTNTELRKESFGVSHESVGAVISQRLIRIFLKPDKLWKQQGRLIPPSLFPMRKSFPIGYPKYPGHPYIPRNP